MQQHQHRFYGPHTNDHIRRKSAALRKEAEKYKDGNGKYRVELSRAKAKLNKA